MRSLVDPVTRLVEEKPRMGWASNIEQGDEGYWNGWNKRLGNA